MRLRRWFLSDDERLVKVKSLRPSLLDGSLCWPVFLVDRRGCGRQTVTPVWDWERVVSPFRAPQKEG